MHVAIVGGSDAGIEAARRCLELDPEARVSLLVADAFLNFSICGIPCHVSGEVPDWRKLAHRSAGDLERLGITLMLDHRVTRIDVPQCSLSFTHHQRPGSRGYDRLILATGANPRRPPITGLDILGPEDGVLVLHSMPESFALADTVGDLPSGSTAVIVGAGYVGLEMAEALTIRGFRVVVVEQLPQVLPRTLDADLAASVEGHPTDQGVHVRCERTVEAIERVGDGLQVVLDRERLHAGMVLVATGVAPATELAVDAGLELDSGGAIAVDRTMRTSIDGVWAAGDCVHTHHRIVEEPGHLPLGTTAHKQGRVAGDNIMGGNLEYAGTLGTQAVKLFERVAAATGLRDAEASKRIDILAVAIHNGNAVADLADLDLCYTAPLGSPWDAFQQAAHAWQASG